MNINDVVEPTFGYDNFQRPAVRKATEALVGNILTILFGKPGFFPSIPELGMDIQQYRYSKFEDIDLDQLKAQLSYQCKLLKEAIEDDTLLIERGYLDKEHLKPILIFSFQVQLLSRTQDVLLKELRLGMTTDGEYITYNYMLTDPEDNAT